jgi:DNA-binding response OmpR family regulator
MTRQYTILVVEDENRLRETVREFLLSEGFDVLTAADAYEAVRMVTERPVDLMFIDIVLPGMNGLDLARQAKLIRPTLRILYATGFPDRAHGTGGRRYGAVMRKPYRMAELLDSVKEALA